MSRLGRAVVSVLLITAACSIAAPIATAATGTQKFDGVTDGSCSQDQAPKVEVDALSASGTMTL